MKSITLALLFSCGSAAVAGPPWTFMMDPEQGRSAIIESTSSGYPGVPHVMVRIPKGQKGFGGKEITTADLKVVQDDVLIFGARLEVAETEGDVRMSFEVPERQLADTVLELQSSPASPVTYLLQVRDQLDSNGQLPARESKQGTPGGAGQPAPAPDPRPKVEQKPQSESVGQPQSDAAELTRSAIFTIPETASEKTPGGVYLASITTGKIHEVLHRPEIQQPAEHQWLKGNDLAEQIKAAYLNASKNPTTRASANVLIGRLEGSGVGPNSSYFTKGESVVVGSLDKERVCQAQINVTISGPMLDGVPMTHGIYFVVPLERLPKDASAIRFEVKPAYKWESGFDEKNSETIKPPSYGHLACSLHEEASGEQTGAGQPATAPESKPQGNDKPQPESKPASR